MLAARARGQRRTHLRNEGEKRALLLAELVGGLALSPLVVLGSPCSRPERVRVKRLERLAVECGPRIERVVIESRGPGLDRNDRRVLAAVGARWGYALPYEFPIGRDEPVLRAADVVASSVFRALRHDINDLLAALGDMTVADIDGV